MAVKKVRTGLGVSKDITNIKSRPIAFKSKALRGFYILNLSSLFVFRLDILYRLLE